MPETPSDLPDETPLSPDQDAAVRRLLAEAGGPEALPDDIEARLAATLAQLQAERSAAPEPAPVGAGVAEEHGVIVPRDELAGRRRTKARVLLAAAAAVVAGAIATGVLTDRSGDEMTAADRMSEADPARTADGADVSAAGGSQPDQAQQDAESDAVAPRDADDSAAQESFPGTTVQRAASGQPLRQVRTDHLREDLVALQHIALADPDAVDYSGTVLVAPEDFRCEPASFGAGHLVGVQYAGRPAVVAFRAPMGSSQETEVLACGTGDTLHSTTLATIH